uniref:GTP-binding protein 10 n=1 Tax=Ciona savignyi TaxID=51511 RepID=H2ZNJ7_CIOSA
KLNPFCCQYSKEFVDKLRIHVRGGTGGNGLPTLGGVGGRGGDVYLVGSQDPKLTLKSMKDRYPMKRFVADTGQNSRFPNAGKSTLLSRLSNASPKVASYPFTTITPQIGLIQYPDFRKIQLADLPGLVEGACLNKGRGHSFLKHIERTKLLLFVVDIHGFQLSPKHQFRDALETLQLLTEELKLYDETLLSKPSLLAVNKMDLPGSEKVYQELIDELNKWEGKIILPSFPKICHPIDTESNEIMKFKEVFPISAQTGIGSQELTTRIRELIDNRTFTSKHMLGTGDNNGISSTETKHITSNVSSSVH